MKTLVTCGAGFISSVFIRHIIPSKSDSVVNADKLAFAGSLETPIDVSQKPRYVLEELYCLVASTRQSFPLGLQSLLIECLRVDLSRVVGVLQRYSSATYAVFFYVY